MAHGYVDGDKAERAKMWRGIEAENIEASKVAASMKCDPAGEPFKANLIAANAEAARRAASFAERYETA